MKTTIFSLIFLLTLILIGCQENSITDPNQVSAKKNNIPDHIVTGSIPLEGNLRTPFHEINSFTKIDGTIEYQLRFSYNNQLSPSSQSSVSLQLAADAVLTNYCTVCTPPETRAGVVSTRLTASLDRGDKETNSVINTYQIQDRDDGLVLKVNLLVTADEVRLGSMWLEKGVDEAKADSKPL